MSITLKPEHEHFIQSQVASGRFANQEEAIDTAFRLLEKVYSEYEKWIEETRENIDMGMAELERGEGLDIEAVVAGIMDRFKQARYQQLQPENKDPLAKLKDSPFIGCFQAEPDLAANSEAILRLMGQYKDDYS